MLFVDYVVDLSGDVLADLLFAEVILFGHYLFKGTVHCVRTAVQICTQKAPRYRDRANWGTTEIIENTAVLSVSALKLC